MRGEHTGGMHGGAKMRWRHRTGKTWRKSSGQPGGGDGVGKAYSRGQGEIAREGEQGSGYAGTDMGNTQVGGGHCTEAGYSGMKMGDDQVDGGPFAGAMWGYVQEPQDGIMGTVVDTGDRGVDRESYKAGKKGTTISDKV